MKLFNFTTNFGSEEDCSLHFKAEIENVGVVCKCGSNKHFWIKSNGAMNIKNAEVGLY